MSDKKLIIGIDLGTTNCTVAFAEADGEERSIQQWPIPQIIAAGTEKEAEMLPSFLYFPLEEEKKKGATAISWDPERTTCVGEYARTRGKELPNRVIGSAKSWLCHSETDPRKVQLPIIAAEEGEENLSPVEVVTALLTHIREAWDEQHAQQPFTAQQIFITVPASFDPSARELIQEAANAAGYPKDIVLLEEPQAAFYAWLDQRGDEWREQLKVNDRVLVVDVGGGTTDFSLIEVQDEEGDLTLERVAVGNHLLLGGDNMDLSLAYIARNQLEDDGASIDEWQMQSLLHECRQAKEKLLGETPPESIDVTIEGRGSGLIGGSLTTTLTKEQVDAVLIDGFMPLVLHEEHPKANSRAGIQQIGLQYAQDPRISCQLAQFLSRAGKETFTLPTAVLFNGGTMQAPALQKRVEELLNSWAKELDQDEVRVLTDNNLNFAVSRGAVYYGLARSGKTIRIRSGTSRNYFIGVEDAMPAVPGVPTPLRAVCVAPFGMEEGTEQALTDQEFTLVLGEQAMFRFLCSHGATLSDGSQPQIGTVVRKWRQELTELAPVETILDQEGLQGNTVRVTLKAKVTELGVLELWCVSPEEKEWKLEFNLRHEEQLVEVGAR